jgi:hypothetical protein
MVEDREAWYAEQLADLGDVNVLAYREPVAE